MKSGGRSEFACTIPGLELRPPGIWYSRTNSPISYPESAHADFLKAEDRSFWFRHRGRCIVDLVRKFSSGGLFLDVGGGNGIVAKYLVEAGKQCVVIEPGVDGALAAHRRGIATVICARVEDISLPADSISDCGIFDVIEHIENDVEVLARIRTWLKPGGRLFLSVPAYQWLFSAEDVYAGHIRRYSAQSLRRSLGAAGFEIVFMSYLFAPLVAPLLLLRNLPFRLGFRHKAKPNIQADHMPGAAIEAGLDRLLDWELRILKRGRSIPFGTSCLCVAQRRSDG